MMQCFEVCCGVLQCVAVYCVVLQSRTCVSVCVCVRVYVYVPMYTRTCQCHVHTHMPRLIRIARQKSFQNVESRHCNTLQHTVLKYNTLKSELNAKSALQTLIQHNEMEGLHQGLLQQHPLQQTHASELAQVHVSYACEISHVCLTHT